MNALRPLLIAIQFLTRLPVRLDREPETEERGRSLLYYPLVGLLLGMVMVGLLRLLPDGTGLVPAALLLASWVLLTGALHLDGLADSADAWIGGLGNAERTLAIMKDPRCGPAAVVAVVLVLLLKFAALHLAIARHDDLALLLAPALGRTAPLLLFLTTPYVRPGGLGDGPARSLPRRPAAWMLAGAVGATVLAGGVRGIWLLVLLGLLFAELRRRMMGRIGGTTGDTAGALVELTECAALLGAALV